MNVAYFSRFRDYTLSYTAQQQKKGRESRPHPFWPVSRSVAATVSSTKYTYQELKSDVFCAEIRY